jgi:hypothetical protein
MRFIKLYDSYISGNDVLIIVDVQKSFRKYFTENYLNQLDKYCLNFKEVYQIWDNHVEGKNPDPDYLYDSNPPLPINNDLYKFNNQKDLIEKRYNYDVDVTFYKKILDNEIYKSIKKKEENSLLKTGDIFLTNKGTAIVYVGNNHNWFHIGKKLLKFLTKLKGRDIIIVGGSKSECLLDVEVSALSLGLNIRKNEKYIYSATYCPIK